MPALSRRMAYAFRCLFAILITGQIPEDILKALAGSPAQAATIPTTPTLASSPTSAAEPAAHPVDSLDRAVQLLALLQRDGRLIDFLTEDIAPYPDAQIGAAVRELHQNCRQVLERYVKLEPVIGSAEGQPVTVPAGFDPAAIKMIGNFTGRPPLRGVLRHRGWRVTQVRFPPLPEAAARSIVAPAEVEIA
jgi:Domain of unknown function (DUF2760)